MTNQLNLLGFFYEKSVLFNYKEVFLGARANEFGHHWKALQAPNSGGSPSSFSKNGLLRAQYILLSYLCLPKDM